MKKAVLIGFLSLLCLCFLNSFTYADDTEKEESLYDVIGEILDNIDFSAVNEFADGEYITGVQEKVSAFINGEYDSATSFLSFVFALFLDKLQQSLPSLLTVFAIVLLYGLLSRDRSGFLSTSTNEVVYLVCYSSVLIIILGAVSNLYHSTYTLFESFSALVTVSMPIILTILIAVGGVNSANVYQPLTAMLSTTVIGIVTNVVLPLFALSLIFSIISQLSEKINITKLSSLSNNLAGGILGATFMIFSAFLTVQGIAVTAADTVYVKTLKFATKNYIPILGGYLSDGVDLMLAGATLVKNAFGVVVLLLAFVAILAPIFDLIVYALCLQLLAAFSEPLTDKRFVTLFNTISKNLIMLVVCILAVLFMFAVLVLLCIGSMGV